MRTAIIITEDDLEHPESRYEENTKLEVGIYTVIKELQGFIQYDSSSLTFSEFGSHKWIKTSKVEKFIKDDINNPEYFL